MRLGAKLPEHWRKHSIFVESPLYRLNGSLSSSRTVSRFSKMVCDSIRLAFTCLLAGCMGGQTLRPHSVTTGGNSDRGVKVIAEYRCGACHTIPGIHGANGVFGPPLNRMAVRSYIGGNFPNNPANLTRWVISPRAMKPKTAMPDLGLTDPQAQDVTAYLETLR